MRKEETTYFVLRILFLVLILFGLFSVSSKIERNYVALKNNETKIEANRQQVEENRKMIEKILNLEILSTQPDKSKATTKPK